MADPVVSESMARALEARLAGLLDPPASSPGPERVAPTAVYTFSRYVVMPQPRATDAAVIEEILPADDWLDVEKELGDRGSTPGVPIGSLPPRHLEPRKTLPTAYVQASPRPMAGCGRSESFGVTIRTRGNATPCRLVRSHDRSGMP